MPPSRASRYDGDEREPSVLLYVKATLTGDETLDVLEYQRQHPRFPHQSVLDQSLDEAQWESYRRSESTAQARCFAEPVYSGSRTARRRCPLLAEHVTSV